MVGCSTPYMKVIGMTPDEALVALKELGINKIRVTSEDDKHFCVTCDYCTDRLNVGVTNGKITSVSGVG